VSHRAVVCRSREGGARRERVLRPHEDLLLAGNLVRAIQLVWKRSDTEAEGQRSVLTGWREAVRQCGSEPGPPEEPTLTLGPRWGQTLARVGLDRGSWGQPSREPAGPPAPAGQPSHASALRQPRRSPPLSVRQLRSVRDREPAVALDVTRDGVVHTLSLVGRLHVFWTLTEMLDPFRIGARP
jgi:hypothetical protein